MEKIKENILDKIRTQIFANPIVSAKLRMNIAENIFIFSAFLYFLLTLMAVSGFIPYLASAGIFFMYPVFLLSIFMLIFTLVNYALTIYAEKLLFLRYGVIGLLMLGYGVLIARHIGLL